MHFNVGDTVCISEDDGLRGGDTATVRQIMETRYEAGILREYLVEFGNPPKQKQDAGERFLLGIYREEFLRMTPS